MALGVDSASNRNEYQKYFLGAKGGRCVRLTTLPPSCAVVMKSGNLNFLEPSGPLQACNGTALKCSYFSFFVFPVSTCLFVIYFISLPFPTSWSIQLNVQALMVNSEIEAVHIYYYVISLFEKPAISFLYHALFRLHNTTFLPSD